MFKKKMKNSPGDKDKFLWVRFGALGDVLQALTCVSLVKEKFPEVKMSFLTTPPYVEIVKSQPYIDEVLCGEKRPLGIMFETIKALRKNRYDWVGSTFKGSHIVFLNLLSGIKNRLGDSSYFPFLQTGNIYEWANSNNINLHDRSYPSICATEENMIFSKKLFSPYVGKKKLFAVIGASKESKKWPLNNWIEFLRPLIADDWTIVLNGHGHKECLFAESIIKEVGRDSILNLVNKLDYMQMAAVVRECDVAVGNDSGPLHMAALSGVPTIGIYDYIQPLEVGYSMPWFSSVISREESLQTFYTKRRSQSLLAEISAKDVLQKFDFHVNKFVFK